MTYKGNNFKKMLSAIVANKHSLPLINITVENYFHNQDNTVQVEYMHTEKGKQKPRTTRIELTVLMEYQMNYQF